MPPSYPIRVAVGQRLKPAILRVGLDDCVWQHCLKAVRVKVRSLAACGAAREEDALWRRRKARM